MDLGGLEKLIASTGVAIAAAMTPFGVIYTAMLNSKNKAAEVTIDSLKADVKKLEERLEKAETSAAYEKKHGLRWYQLLMFWFNMAHEMRRCVYDTRQIAESIARLGNQPKPVWHNDLLFPDIEDPKELPDKG